MNEALERLTAALADRYRIERELGQGGMATVYLAQDLKHDRQVAIKVLHPELGAALGGERFLSEIKTTARLHHPHILPLYDSGKADGLLFYVMPLVEGESLRDRMDREKGMPIAEAVQIVRDVADALAHAHARDVIHRDIKPENILLEGGHALVADFGIARAVSAAGATRITQTGFAIGTPAYMSPEQAAGDPDIDGRSDLYSLACVLFEMLTGEAPFTGATAEAILVQRFTQVAPRVSTKRTEVPPQIDTAVSRAMARNPQDRFGTIGRFADALVSDGGRGAATADKSIAVLPFENMSGDKENDYFGDGIAEEIIIALTQLDGLRVAARTSAFSFKGKTEDLRLVGEKLNVTTVLEGSVRKAGNRIRITAQLINTSDGYHLWSERYDRELTDIFAVQDEIAGAIATKLRVALDADRIAKPSQPATSNVEAYQLCLKGRTLAAQRGGSIPAALGCFEKAVALDPNYAAAYEGLADALRLQVMYGFARPEIVMPKAKAAVSRALELDPDLAEALASRAAIAISHDYDTDAAFADWERALALKPMLTSARMSRAFFGLSSIKRLDDRAVAEAALAVANDPLSAVAAAFNALVLGFASRHKEAVAEGKRAVELDPEAFIAHFACSSVLSWAGHQKEALGVAQRALQMSGRHAWILGTVVGMHMRKGDATAALAAYDEIMARAKLEYVQSFWLGLAAFAVGRVDEGAEHCIRSIQQRESTGPGWLRWPGLEAFWTHPRYPEMIKLVGLE